MSFNNAALDQGRDRIVQIAQSLNQVQTKCKLQLTENDDYMEQLDFSLVSVVHEWSKGLSFTKVIKIR